MEEYKKDSHWIWSPSWNAQDKDCPRIMLFRKAVQLNEAPVEGTLKISADTRYKLYVNGRLAETGPSRGDQQVWFYDTVDLVPYLKRGENVISVAVLRYPLDPEKGNHGMFRTFVPGLYAAGTIKDADKKEYEISADRTWKCRMDRNIAFYREEERFAPLVIHENTKGNTETFGWKEIGYDDSGWEAAQPYIKKLVPKAVSPGNLMPRTIPYMYRSPGRFKRVMDLKKSCHTVEEWEQFLSGKKEITIPPDTEEIVELDAGEEMTGYIWLSLADGTGAQVTLLYAEAYVQDETAGPEQIPVKGDRMDCVHGRLHGYEDHYTAAGLGTAAEPEVYEPYWFRTFRFVRLSVRTAAERVTLERFDYEQTGYPLETAALVKTSDASLEPVWEISERTLRRCMHETYVDCPFYEQLQYIMDARVQVLYTYAVSADDRLARKCMDDFRRAQRYDGMLNCSYPNCNTNVIPGFSIYYILMVYDHMMYFGDRDFIVQHMPAIDQILHYFETHLTKEGYVEKIGGVNTEARFWSFIDWAQEWKDTSGMSAAGLRGPITMETLLYIYGLQHAADLADFLGRPQEAGVYRARAGQAKKAVVLYCTGENGMIQDGPGMDVYSQHCQVFALLTDTVDLETGKKNLQETIENPGYAQCTVAMRFYLFRALEKAGCYAYTKRYWDAWKNMVRLNCTTCVESEAYARSECHAWGSLILYELPSVTLGVRPAEPGYAKIRIAPERGYFTNASGVVKTPKGEVRVSWNIHDGQMQLEYEAPADMEVVSPPGKCR